MGDVRLAGTFAKQLQIIQQEFSDYQICPIPLATARLKERGFNQVIEMLRVAKIPYSQLLTRSDHSLPQSQKTRQERLKTTQPFKLAVVPTIIKGKKVLLVDDVYTTGQTLFHAASCLLPHAPEKIRTFSLAR
ncbi:comF family protein [Enterococcus hirae]|nr:comF family protein [Enterococcus hirae]